MTDLVGVVLAAGAGTRLRPLTDVRPKPLCTVGGRTLLDLALERLAPHVRPTAVNAHHLADQVRDAVADRDLHLSVERPVALGTAGALGRLRGWIDGATVLVTNADAFFPHGDPVGELLADWDGERPRLLCVRDGDRGDFGDLRYVGTALLPWWSVRDLAPRAVRSLRGLVARSCTPPGGSTSPSPTCRPSTAAPRPTTSGRTWRRPAVHRWSEPGAVVEGELVRSVVWSGERVGPDERLVDAIRAAGVTLNPLAGDTPR